jgi:hypothetical protein
VEINKIENRFEHVFFNYPQILSEKIDFDMPTDEMKIVGSLLRNSAVMINMFSTLSLESALTDTPIINVSFEGYGKKKGESARQKIEIDERNTHNQRVLQLGGSRNVYTIEELINQINNYLKNPNLDSEGRKSIVKEECGPFLGKAGVTIAERVLRLL